eukprot:194833_1
MSAANNTAFQIWIGMIIIVYLIGFFQIYAFWKFKSIENLCIIKTRYPSIIKAEAKALLFYLFVAEPLFQNILLNATDSGSTIIENVKFCISYTLMTCSIQFIGLAETARLWLIFFDLQHLNSLKTETWKVHLNQEAVETDWYFRNRLKWGNKAYIIKRVLIWYLITSTLMIVDSCAIYILYPAHDFQIVSKAIDGILNMLPLSIVLYTFYKCPKNLNG